VDEGHAVGGRDGLEVPVVAHDEGDVDLQLAGVPAVQQVAQAVVVLADEDRGAGPVVGRPDLEVVVVGEERGAPAQGGGEGGAVVGADR
jgi:hypothetical protein